VIVAQIETESIFYEKTYFFMVKKKRPKKAPFFALEKNVLWKNLEVESWNWHQKKPLN
jgi:hypothetical protein